MVSFYNLPDLSAHIFIIQTASIATQRIITSWFIFVEVVSDSLCINISTGPFVTAWQENKSTWSQGQEMNSAKKKKKKKNF